MTYDTYPEREPVVLKLDKSGVLFNPVNDLGVVNSITGQYIDLKKENILGQDLQGYVKPSIMNSYYNPLNGKVYLLGLSSIHASPENEKMALPEYQEYLDLKHQNE